MRPKCSESAAKSAQADQPIFEKNIWTQRREWVQQMEAVHAAEAAAAQQKAKSGR